MSANCNVIVFLPIYGQLRVTQKPDSGRIACKSYIFINSYFLSYKNWKQNYKIPDITMSNRVLVLKSILSGTTCATYVPTFKFSAN